MGEKKRAATGHFGRDGCFIFTPGSMSSKYSVYGQKSQHVVNRFFYNKNDARSGMVEQNDGAEKYMRVES